MLQNQGSSLIPKVGKPVIKFNNVGVRSVLVLLNGRAGWRQALNYFNATLQYQLDREGVVYKVRNTPPDDLGMILKTEKASMWEAVAIVGGDGSLNAYINHAFAPEAYDRWHEKPIVLIPTGTHNSVAHSVGIDRPEATVGSLRYGKIKKMPLWGASLGNVPVALVAAGVSVGFYADTVHDAHQLKLRAAESSTMPMPKRRQLWSSLYNTMYRYRSLACNLEVYSDMADDALPDKVIKGPFRTLIASHVPLQHSGYSLTPSANGDDGLMHVTMAKAECTRMRMLHLVHREGPARALLEEDGVSTVSGRKIVFDFYEDAPVEDEELEAERKKAPWDPRLIGSPTRLGLFDGEVYPLPATEELVLKPTGLFAPIMIP